VCGGVRGVLYVCVCVCGVCGKCDCVCVVCVCVVCVCLTVCHTATPKTRRFLHALDCCAKEKMVLYIITVTLV